MLTPEENKIRYELYNQGLNDVEIANAVETERTNIRAWRRRNSLKANRGKGNHLNSKANDIRLELYDRGLNDKQIAHIICVTPQCIYAWRKVRKLKANKGV